MKTSNTILKLFVGVLKFVFKLSHVLTLLIVLTIVALANAQTTTRKGLNEEIRKGTVLPSDDPRVKYVGRVARNPPINYWMEGNTIFIGGTYAKENDYLPQHIFEMELKPEDINLVKGLVELEINDKDQEPMYFRMSEKFNGRTVKVDAIQIGDGPIYYFEPPKKQP